MSKLLIKFIAGFVCIARWMMENSNVAAGPCRTNYLKSGVNVDCKNKEIYSVPMDLDHNTHSLDISNNDICKFTRQSFAKYRSLRELLMTNLRCTWGEKNPCKKNFITIDIDTFFNSDALRIMDISNSPICSIGSAKFKWPRNLQRLTLHNSRHVAFQFLELQNLEILEASNCDKYYFPKLHPTAPLQEIDVRDNNISLLTVELIAGYCELKILKLNVLVDDLKVQSDEASPEPPNGDFYCMYQRLIKWAELRDISGVENLNCFKKEANSDNYVHCSSETPCDLSFEKAEQLYNSCRAMRWNLFINILITSLLLIIFILITVLITWFLKKSFSIYRGRRSEVFLDYYDRDYPSSYYESGSEMESDYQRSRSSPSPTKISSKSGTPKKLIPKEIPVQYYPRRGFKPAASRSIQGKVSPELIVAQSIPKKLNSRKISSQSIQR